MIIPPFCLVKIYLETRFILKDTRTLIQIWRSLNLQQIVKRQKIL